MCDSIRCMKTSYLRWTSALAALAYLFVALPSALANGEDWKWLGEKRGVKLWKLERPKQSLPGFRGQTEIQGSIERIVAEMLDVRHHTEWMHRCAESWIYEHGSDTHGILYNRTSSAPWPVWDRDVVLDVHFDYNQARTALTVRFRNLDDKLRPSPERVVRMPKLVGYYKMTEDASQRTTVTYQVEADIGGSIPDWIADEVTKDLPFYTLLALRERVEALPQKDKPKQALPVALELPKASPKTLQAVRD